MNFIKLKNIYDNADCCGIDNFEEFEIEWCFCNRKFVPAVNPYVYYICG